MSDKPILFSAPMVRALLADRKTQTRRALKPQPHLISDGCSYSLGEDSNGHSLRWSIGDRLWVREAWSPEHKWTGTKPRDIPNGDDIWYWADGNPDAGDWTEPKLSIHMPRWASRITLEVTAVRVQRLQDISAADARSEGIVVLPMQDPEDPSAWWESEPGKHQGRTPQQSYRKLWNDINGAGAWAANPWVVAVTFRRIANTS